VAEARENLQREGLPLPDSVPLGIMVEVPAAVQLAPHLAREVDFFALGTNDLIQYMLAADRANPMVHRYYEPLHPAILLTIQQLVTVARQAGRGLCICGEMASDPCCLPLLVGLGVREFSVSAPFILRLKQLLANWPLARLEQLANEALRQDDPRKIRELVAALPA